MLVLKIIRDPACLRYYTAIKINHKTAEHKEYQYAINKVLKTAAPKFNKTKFENAVTFALTQTKNHDPAKEVGDDSFVKEALDAAMAKKEREDRMKDVMDKFGDLFKKSKTDEQEFSH